ncbi:MAG: AsmA family protein, partial [Candidatus Aminicenantales bacterium]
MRKSLKRALKIAGLVFGSIVVLLAVAILLVLFDKPLIRKISQSYITKKAGLPIQIGKLDYTLFPLHVTLSEVKTTSRTPIFTMDVVVNRLEAAGNLRRLLKGTKPAFDTVDADIAELRFDQEKISPEPIDFRGIILQTSSILAYTRQASITCGRMSVTLPGQNFAFDNLTLALSKAAAANVYDLRLASDKATAGMNEGHLSLESPLRVDGTLTLARSAAANLRLALDAAHFTAAGRDETLQDLTLDIDGAWDTSENGVRVANLALGVPGLVAVSASGSAGLNKPLSLEASGNFRFESLQFLAVVLGPSLPPDFRDVRLRGRSRLAGTYMLSLGSDAKAGSLEASLELDRFGLEYDKAGTPLKLELSGTLKA